MKRLLSLTIPLLLCLACSSSPGPECDGCIPIVTIDTPDQDDLMCDEFSLEGQACGGPPSFVSIAVYVDGEEIEFVDFEEYDCYNFEYEIHTYDFPVHCGEVEIEVVATDSEGNEASEQVDVFLCNDATDPIVNLIPQIIDLDEGECVDIAVEVHEENFLSYELIMNGNLFTEEETLPSTLTFCDPGLLPGENLIVLQVTDICGNEGVGTASISTPPYFPPTCEVLFPEDGDCLCGPVTFMVGDCDYPNIAEIQFFFDGESVPRHTDSTPPYEYSVDVNTSFEPETHNVWAKVIFDDASEGVVDGVGWVKSCPPHAEISDIEIDVINRIISLSGFLSTDDNLEPGLSFAWQIPECAVSEGLHFPDVEVDVSACPGNEFEIGLTVSDGWCGGSDTQTLTIQIFEQD